MTFAHPKTILVHVVTPRHDDVAVACAGELARRSGASLVVCVRRDEVGDAQLSSLVSELREAGLDAQGIARGGRRVAMLADTAHEIGAELLVVAVSREERTGPESTLFATRLLRRSPCPVWIARPGRSTRVARIIAAVRAPKSADEPSLDHDVIHTASELAKSSGADLHVVSAWQEMTSPRSIRHVSPRTLREYQAWERQEHGEQLRRFLSPYGVPSSNVHRVRRLVVPAIAQSSARLAADLVVVGSARRRGLGAFFIGNTAESLVAATERPVLSVPRMIEATGGLPTAVLHHA